MNATEFGAMLKKMVILLMAGRKLTAAGITLTVYMILMILIGRCIPVG